MWRRKEYSKYKKGRKEKSKNLLVATKGFAGIINRKEREKEVRQKRRNHIDRERK